jgi:hypothetical protein
MGAAGAGSDHIHIGEFLVRRRVSVACLPAMVGLLMAAPAAPAATLSVDDDRRDCTAAAYTSVQDAVDAAAPGDTIAICPGHYAEGNGLPNTSALKIDKTLTLKGAGADLVTISPVRYDGNDGVIADDQNDQVPGSQQDIRYPSGNIVTAVGTPAVPITVDISGVTFDGDGVAAKAGVVFLDAQGSLRRSRVTDIVTSEAPNAYGMQGGYRSEYLGYGVAQVTAAQTAPVGAGPRTLTIANTRIDEYNRVGVLIDGGIDSAIPVTASGIDLRGVISTSQIVGRQQCWDTNVDGICGGPTPAGNPDPKPIPDGPLFGQDGVRLAAGARGEIAGSLISQNLVQGTGAPVRNSTTNNANLRQGAGIRLVGGDSGNSSVTRSNIVDNAYGVLNVAADNSADAPSLMRAENNWWGLCSPVGSSRCNGEPNGNTQPPNNGPAVSPTRNPGYPENPVNGLVDATFGSNVVDFLPYRSGPQSDPNTGQFPVVPAPIPVSDAPPAVTVSVERAEYFPGETVLITAAPSDDFGIRQVTFFNGASDLGSDRTPVYSAAFTLPKGMACGDREVAATAEDSLGQTATGTATFEVLCDDGGTLQPPTVQIPSNVTTIPREGRTVTVEPVARQGVASVDFFLGDRQVCHDTGAPFSCLIKPLASEAGKQTLRVVVTDRAGLTGEDEREVQVPKADPKKVQVTVKREALSRDRVRRTVSVTVIPPAGVSRAVACAGKRITAVVRHRGRTILNREIKLNSACRAVVLRTTVDARKRGPRYKASIRFGGSTVLATAQKTRRFR